MKIYLTETRWIAFLASISVLVFLFQNITAQNPQASKAAILCEPPPPVIKALASLPDDAALPLSTQRQKKVEALRLVLKSFPDDLFVHLAIQDTVLDGSKADRDVLIEQYRTTSAERPDDPIYLYLYARLLIGRNTSKAQELLRSLLDREPNFIWAHHSLANSYGLPRYQDKAKAVDESKLFFAACHAPLTSEAYRILSNGDDREFQKDIAAELRTRLEKTTSVEEIALYETLWKLEFRVLPTTEHTKLRSQIDTDLRRLRQMNLSDSKPWLETLRAGYRIVNDKAARRWAEDEIITRFPRSTSAKNLIIGHWEEENPAPAWDGPKEKFESYYAKLVPATEDWIKRWPYDSRTRYRRFSALAIMKASKVIDVETAFENLHDEPGVLSSIPPPPVRMADFYLRRNVKLYRVPELITRGFAEAKAAVQEGSDSDASSPGSINGALENLKSIYWSGWPMLADAYLKARQPAKAREVVDQMEAQLVAEKPDQKANASGYQWHESTYWEWAGRVAQAEGRRLDALVFYQNALMARSIEEDTAKTEKDELTLRIHRLWTLLGGTANGWEKWSNRGANVVAVNVNGDWQDTNRPLPDFELTDLGGRKWRLADLKGKIAFINIWATWCGPCHLELPYVQKLYERAKDRANIVVLSLNIDEDLGPVDPYLKEKKYSFPVIPARSYVTSMMGSVAIPRSWIVGPDGVLVKELIGLGPQGDNWLQNTSAIIEKLGMAK